MTSCTVKIPAKVMLAGEYSVLHGGTALASTLDSWLTVRLSAATGHDDCRVRSALWSDERRVRAVDPEPPGDSEPLLQSAWHGLQAITADQTAPATRSYDLSVDAGIDISSGIGSSSAVRLGVLAAFRALRAAFGNQPAPAPADLWQDARLAWQLQQRSQTQASGYDMATQLLGGLVEFVGSQDREHWPVRAERLTPAPDFHAGSLLHLFVGGRGAPTRATISTMMQWLTEGNTARMAGSVNEALVAAFRTVLHDVRPETLRHLLRVCSAHRRLFESSPSFPRRIRETLASLPGLDREFSYKTTGAGGEDAILVIGTADTISAAAAALAGLGWHRLGTGFTENGLQIRLDAQGGGS